MSGPAENMIARNLSEALARLHDDLERVELWTAALGCFARPAPEYRPRDQYLLSPSLEPAAEDELKPLAS